MFCQFSLNAVLSRACTTMWPAATARALRIVVTALACRKYPRDRGSALVAKTIQLQIHIEIADCHDNVIIMLWSEIRYMDGCMHRRRDRQSDIPNVLLALVKCGLFKSMQYYVRECKTRKRTRCFCFECGSVASCQCRKLELSWYIVRAL